MYVPLVVVALLVLVGVLQMDTVMRGVIGTEFMQPWKILIIFFTVAYVAVSTDRTGLFEHLAHKIVHRARGNGLKLFVAFYLFAGALTVVTSNDIVILTLTPIIFYLGKYAKINIIPFLFAEFFAAHTFSMLLYTGDPTNIIVATTLGLGFLEYAKVMLLPTVVAACVSFGLLYLFFRKSIAEKFKEIKRNEHVSNRVDAYGSFAFLILMLATLVFSDKFSLEIWGITSVFAGLFLLKDIIVTFSDRCRLKNSFLAVPWHILPFIVSFFIFVQAITELSLMSDIAYWFVSMSETTTGSIFSFGFIGAVLANVINNQPMTIFLTHVLVSPIYEVGDAVRTAGAYALVVASNIGATFTLFGALAGIMWHKILKDKGLSISYFKFVKNTFLIALPTLVVTLLSLTLIF